jgi:hypothetical protein
MKLINRIGKKLNPKTKREEVAEVEEDIETTPIRRPLLQYFIASDPMEVATELGLVEIAAGDYVTVSETGQIKIYTEEAFRRAFVEADAAAPAGRAPMVDADSRNRLDVLEGQTRNLNNFLTDLGSKVERLLNDAAAAAKSAAKPTG